MHSDFLNNNLGLQKNDLKALAIARTIKVTKPVTGSRQPATGFALFIAGSLPLISDILHMIRNLEIPITPGLICIDYSIFFKE
jgi:hypothetical protein